MYSLDIFNEEIVFPWFPQTYQGISWYQTKLELVFILRRHFGRELFWIHGCEVCFRNELGIIRRRKYYRVAALVSLRQGGSWRSEVGYKHFASLENHNDEHFLISRKVRIFTQ